MLTWWCATLLAFSLPLPQQSYEPGMTYRMYDIQQSLSELSPLVAGQTPNVDQRISRIDFSNSTFPGMEIGAPKDNFYVEVTGELNLNAAGPYEFRITSDDGAEFLIDGKQVASNDGVHAASSKVGTFIGQGWKPFVLRYFEAVGSEFLRLEWRTSPNQDWKVVDENVSRVPAGITRVTSPGKKRMLIAGGSTRPGKGAPLAGLNPGWRVNTVRPVGFEPKVGGLAFLPDGRLILSTFLPHNDGVFDPSMRDGKLYLLTGIQQNDRRKMAVKEIAANLKDPLGLVVVPNKKRPKGYSIYVSQQFEITELIDDNNDDVIDTYKTVANGWESDNYHHFTFGLLERNGWLYGSLSTTIGGGRGINGPNPVNRGTVFRVNPEAFDAKNPKANIEFVSGGHRTPNGLSWGPEGGLLVGENQGAWQPANRLNLATKGAFFGHYNDIDHKNSKYPNGGNPGPYDDQPLKNPAIFIPQDEAGNSPAQGLLIPNGPFKGQMYLTDVKYGGLNRVYFEKVNGSWQGGILPSTQGLESGSNRLVWGPDGALYYGGIGATDSWAWVNPATGNWTQFGLQRLSPSGKTSYEIAKVAATTDGFEIFFNQKVNLKSLLDLSNYSVKQWFYAPTPDYGGDKKGLERLIPSLATAGKDGKSVRLVIPGLKRNRVVHLVADPKSAKGESLWAAETWYTMNEIPGKTDVGLRVLVFSKTAGFRHDSIPAGIAMLKTIGAQRSWIVSATEDSTEFNPSNLAKMDVVVFLNTTGDVLNPEQQLAFEAFIKRKGGYVGIHSASDTEYDWPFYGQLVGGYFASHPHIQPSDILIEDRAHPATAFLPDIWKRTDEWYDFKTNPRKEVTVLASLVKGTVQGSKMDDHPIMWCHEKLGGRSFYTGLGHTKETFAEPKFIKMMEEAIVWASRKKG